MNMRLRFALMLGLTAVLLFPVNAFAAKTCWPSAKIPAVTIPAVTIPAVTIPAVTIPAVTIPGSCFGGTCYPAQSYPAQSYPAHSYPSHSYASTTIPASVIPGGCYSIGRAFSTANTTIRFSNYKGIDAAFSPRITNQYWRKTGFSSSIPDPSAPGYGGYNAAGFPKNQYVKSYFRSDGTQVSGYWRNSSSDGLPTCSIINC
jgi:hypothetical protein